MFLELFRPKKFFWNVGCTKYLDKSLVMSFFCSKCFYVFLLVLWSTKNLFKSFIIFNSLLMNFIIIIVAINFFLLITIYLSHCTVYYTIFHQIRLDITFMYLLLLLSFCFHFHYPITLIPPFKCLWPCITFLALFHICVFHNQFL